MVLDGRQRPDFAAGLVGNSSDHRKLHQLALRASIYSADHRFSSFAGGRYPCPARLLDFSGRIDLDATLVRYCTGRYRIGVGCETGCADRGTLVSFLAFFFIVVSLLSFIVAQLVLKRAMEFSAKSGLRNSRFISLISVGTALMTISFFLTLGLLQRFDLSYLYPFQGLSVIFITLMAAVVLKEKLNFQLIVGALLISAGIVLVSIS
jgi:transporter family protein